MSLFLAVREGETNDDADDILVVNDAALLRDPGRLLARRLGLSEASERALRAVPVRGPGEDGDR
jgi:hypothetical protein